MTITNFFSKLHSIETYRNLSVFLLFVLFVLGLVILIYGSDFILKGASNFARLIRISEYVIGITIIALSTSLPEFFISVDASLKGFGIIALANVVGSNIFNIILIFMVLSLFAKYLFKLNIKFLFILFSLQFSLLALALFKVSPIPRIIGILYLLGLIAYFYWELRQPQKQEPASTSKMPSTAPTTLEDNDSLESNLEKSTTVLHNKVTRGIGCFLLMLLGSAMLYLGAEIFINSISTIGQKIGISDLVIGVVFVALGTSLPELMVTVLALIQIAKLRTVSETSGSGLQHMAEGNIIGSSIINILGVFGFTIFAKPTAGISSLLIDIIIMNLAGFMLIMFLIPKRSIQKLAGVLMFVFLISYLLYMYTTI